MPRFKRTIENFECQNCHTFVKGNGYTNHCPECLYSLHSDNNPGDRQNLCLGMMKPIDIVIKGGNPIDVMHQCTKCSLIKTNRLHSDDSVDAIIEIMKIKVKQEMMR